MRDAIGTKVKLPCKSEYRQSERLDKLPLTIMRYNRSHSTK